MQTGERKERKEEWAPKTTTTLTERHQGSPVRFSGTISGPASSTYYVVRDYFLCYKKRF